MKRESIIFLGLSILLVLLFLLDLCSGSSWINIWYALQNTDSLDARILADIRLPKALTAILAGIALSVSGLMMQTLFRNPLAGPYILGVSSGAGLGVALVTMVGTIWVGSMVSNWAISLSAIVGATLVLLLVLFIARRVRSNVSLLIVGMMFGSVAGALVNLIQNYANPDSLKLFIVWTLGSLNSVGWSELPILLSVVFFGSILTISLMKPLNGLMLGENYARGLGIHVNRIRVMIVLATGLLAGGITAFCGPIAFIGVAVPHIARGIYHTSNHRQIIPAVALIGADILLICDVVASATTYPLPISTVSALFGAPVIIWIILHQNG
ncbi:MAG: iron ABC transporter permease [Paludibacteraceae bacterium]|nr:iron ABC transporter permease [Paludibacteraceae bacterium]